MTTLYRLKGRGLAISEIGVTDYWALAHVYYGQSQSSRSLPHRTFLFQSAWFISPLRREFITNDHPESGHHTHRSRACCSNSFFLC
jgi:hypothetical protein